MRSPTVCVGALLTVLTLSGSAQESRPATNAMSSVASKPAGPARTPHEAAWEESFSDAKKAAAERGVPILADFSGSDWCGWCIKLDREVFSDKTFTDFAAANLVLFMADFPRRKAQSTSLKEQNRKLADEYRVEGFPTVLLLDATGKELARTGYRPGGAEKYVQHLKGLIGTGGR